MTYLKQIYQINHHRLQFPPNHHRLQFCTVGCVFGGGQLSSGGVCRWRLQGRPPSRGRPANLCSTAWAFWVCRTPDRRARVWIASSRSVGVLLPALPRHRAATAPVEADNTWDHNTLLRVSWTRAQWGCETQRTLYNIHVYLASALLGARHAPLLCVRSSYHRLTKRSPVLASAFVHHIHTSYKKRILLVTAGLTCCARCCVLAAYCTAHEM
jgi:hypothetical protein